MLVGLLESSSIAVSPMASTLPRDTLAVFSATSPSQGPMSTSNPVPSANTPSTQGRAVSVSNSSSSCITHEKNPLATPGWMRPLHLVDHEQSIYKKPFGSGVEKQRYCLYCFRRRGEFVPVRLDGCPNCGKHDLEDRYYLDGNNELR